LTTEQESHDHYQCFAQAWVISEDKALELCLFGMQRMSHSLSLMGEEFDVVAEGRLSFCHWRKAPSFVL
jgi:hypothetical protein